MKCSFCGCLQDRVVDSREGREGEVIRWRRECVDCGRRSTTYEKIESVPYQVVKRDERREPFDREKLMNGLAIACRKRPVSADAIDALADHIESVMQESTKREISSDELGRHVMERLRDLDQVAYVRFASVYRRFEDVEQFARELDQLKEE